jgi:hypothetical protein
MSFATQENTIKAQRLRPYNFTDLQTELLKELVTEQAEKIQALINHYQTNVDALANAGKEPDEQQRNHHEALVSNLDRHCELLYILKELSK